MIVFGIIGYLMKKFGYPAAPLVLALILGPMLEKNLGQSVMMAMEVLPFSSSAPYRQRY